MAAKNEKASNFRDILSQIKKKELAPIYLLQGEETYYLDALANEFEDNVIAESDRDFNHTVLYGAETDVPSIVSVAQQYPFMADRRLVLVRESQAIPRAKQELEKLAFYAQRPNEETTLVIVYKGEPFKASSLLLKAIKSSGGVVFTSNRLKEYELKGPVRDYVTGKKLGIDDDAIEILTALVGSDLTKIFGEIDKMVIATGNKMNRINSALVRSMTGISKEFDRFELSKAIGRRDYIRTMVIVTQASRNPSKNPSAVMIASLFTLFRNICIGHRLADKSEMSIIQATGVKNSYAARDILDAMRNYNLGQAMEAISAIREFDCNMKGIRSQQKEHELLRELAFRILTC